jgi:Ni,Fe-hydrogenase maturation factor
MDGQVNQVESEVVQKAKELGIFKSEPGTVVRVEKGEAKPLFRSQPEVTLDQLKQALMILTEGIDKLDDKVDAVQLAIEQVAETIEDLTTDLREEVFGRDFVGRDDV